MIIQLNNVVAINPDYVSSAVIRPDYPRHGDTSLEVWMSDGRQLILMHEPHVADGLNVYDAQRRLVLATANDLRERQTTALERQADAAEAIAQLLRESAENVKPFFVCTLKG